MIASRNFANIAIIVPTIALIDETRRRLGAFRSEYKIITHSFQEPSDNNIFILTQERALELDNLSMVDFFVIDEFYKLHPRGEDQDRSFLLNQIFYRLLKTARQFYLLGPNIEQIPVGFTDKYKCTFIKTDYVTVASDVERISARGKEDETLVEICGRLG